MKRLLIYVSYLVLGVGIALAFFGPALFPVADCNPRALFGCGLLDVGPIGVLRTLGNGLFKALEVALFAGVAILIYRLASGGWPKWFS